MSRGPGRLERAILQLFDANPDQAFTTDDLIRQCYPSVDFEQYRLKHRVAVQRAARNVLAFDTRDWEGRRAGICGDSGLLIFVNRASVRSTAIADLIVEEARSTEGRVGLSYWCKIGHALEDKLTWPGMARRMRPSGEYHRQVQEYLAERPDPPTTRAEMRAPLSEETETKLQHWAERISEAWMGGRPVNVVPRRPTLTVTADSLAGLAASIRELATQNDPDVVRQKLTEIADMLDATLAAHGARQALAAD